MIWKSVLQWSLFDCGSKVGIYIYTPFNMKHLKFFGSPLGFTLTIMYSHAVHIALLPSSLSLSLSQGKYYMLLEFISQFYRNLLPLPLWFRYLSNSHHSGAIFAIIITAAYLMIKGGVTLARTRELYRAIIDFIQDPVSCPVIPSLGL